MSHSEYRIRPIDQAIVIMTPYSLTWHILYRPERLVRPPPLGKESPIEKGQEKALTRK